ncbi:hypothetical protein BBAD15_g2815 [Beauveria bassiana D1-5]|uniref:Uncharacterized protein n=1 Tax=Beauveria bassiana D1-5 TaxID=1245745 RepID=A0A0A2VZ48_BEABA|nr:hypothetical protein BBAD15_g2815 [Beauveria bassiana D1-5]
MPPTAHIAEAAISTQNKHDKHRRGDPPNIAHRQIVVFRGHAPPGNRPAAVGVNALGTAGNKPGAERCQKRLDATGEDKKSIYQAYHHTAQQGAQHRHLPGKLPGFERNQRQHGAKVDSHADGEIDRPGTDNQRHRQRHNQQNGAALEQIAPVIQPQNPRATARPVVFSRTHRPEALPPEQKKLSLFIGPFLLQGRSRQHHENQHAFDSAYPENIHPQQSQAVRQGVHQDSPQQCPPNGDHAAARKRRAKEGSQHRFHQQWRSGSAGAARALCEQREDSQARRNGGDKPGRENKPGYVKPGHLGHIFAAARRLQMLAKAGVMQHKLEANEHQQQINQRIRNTQYATVAKRHHHRVTDADPALPGKQVGQAGKGHRG